MIVRNLESELTAKVTDHYEVYENRLALKVVGTYVHKPIF